MTSSIEWTDETWNPVTGCTKVSQGCKNCYAERMAKRLKAMGQPRYINGFNVTLQEDLINLPYKWRKSRKVFVNSMSDLFHKDIPFDFIHKIFHTMWNCHWHEFQVLTKRPKIMAEFSKQFLKSSGLELSSGKLPKNILMGTSVENMDVISRIDALLEVPAHSRFLSCEPLLGPLDLKKYLSTGQIHWVIVGGESGPRSRPIEKQWVLDIRDQCLEYNIPFFFKQWGGSNKKKSGRELDGIEYHEFPNG